MVFQTKENPTFKDNDFTKDNAKLRIGDEVKKDLLQRVKDDVEVRLLDFLHGLGFFIAPFNCPYLITSSPF